MTVTRLELLVWLLSYKMLFTVWFRSLYVNEKQLKPNSKKRFQKQSLFMHVSPVQA